MTLTTTSETSHFIPVRETAVIYVSHLIHGKTPLGVPFEIVHDYDAYANHRLRSIHGAGFWSGYREIAVLVVGEIGKTFHGYTDYFGESVLEVRALLCPKCA